MDSKNINNNFHFQNNINFKNLNNLHNQIDPKKSNLEVVINNNLFQKENCSKNTLNTNKDKSHQEIKNNQIIISNNNKDKKLTTIIDNKNSNNSYKNEIKSELNMSLEFDTDIGSNSIKIDTIENQESSPIEDSLKKEDKTNQESNSSKILIKDLKVS